MVDNIGARVRAIRKQNGTTLTELAQQTDLSPAYISNLERGLCSPTLENIQRICSALGMDMMKLLDDREWADKVIRADERAIIYEKKGSVRYESINFGAGRMTGEYIVVEPSCEYDKEWTHAYDEIGYILEGELTIQIDNETFELHQGDAFYIDASRRHNLSNRSDKRCASLWVKQPAEGKNEMR